MHSAFPEWCKMVQKVKGILTDVKLRAPVKIWKFEFVSSYYRISPLSSTLPKGIRLKSFQYEMRTILTESL